MTCSGSNASIFGRTQSSRPVYFRIDVVDGGAGGDRFRFKDSQAYDSGDRPLANGNVLVR